MAHPWERPPLEEYRGARQREAHDVEARIGIRDLVHEAKCALELRDWRRVCELLDEIDAAAP